MSLPPRPPLGSLGRVSALGIGSALGEPSDEVDARYESAITVALECGVTIIDTAINYRCQRSERVIGSVLWKTGRRDSVLISTKGGYLPLDSSPPSSKERYRAYIKREYIDTGLIEPDELVAGGHCIAPRFLRDQIARSRSNLGVKSIDLYYLHSPEQQLVAVTRDDFGARLHASFTELEQAKQNGAIRAYGCATWSGLIAPPDSAGHLSLEMVVGVARAVAGDAHGLAAVQIPVSLGMTDAVRSATQLVNGKPRTAIEAADELGIAVVVVAPLLQGRLTRDLPQAAHEAFPEARSDAECALAFTRIIPNVASIVVGMSSTAHVRENVAQLMS